MDTFIFSSLVSSSRHRFYGAGALDMRNVARVSTYIAVLVRPFRRGNTFAGRIRWPG